MVRKGGLFHGLAAVRRLQLARWGRAEPLADPATYLDPNAETGLGGWDKPAAVTGLIVGALRAEGAFSRAAAAAGLEFPGLSWWALCRKP